ncbi:NAD(P)-dependent alcohol dehydrogenase [Aldersonia sp. NBC_00410]|uniref:NAD(P)-dependent alcohol dehydrogenase n=1 Tax=Aldersonia sp. NBC_00410 TaxID=2975954 RepID=UPI00224F4DE1|nr:NAD(P)-dependent alcohol dehydrogenase [Aldersonia sp. NBC_00410]MCX5042528.1 NAD(P)-dependent alcohol dehydrogenase [Aldersonia sp. NBC_00410]
MRAVVQDRYGPPSEVLAVRDVERPRPGPDEVLVQVQAASVHPDVWHVVTGRPYALRLMGSGLRRPTRRIPGTDMAGLVVETGDGVAGFAPGDAVFGETVRGYQWRNGGAFAEYVAVPAQVLAPRPANLTPAQAAAVPTSGLIALHNLPDADALAGRSVLVNGAAGGVGACAVQIARARGATVTGVDAGAKLDFVRALGADRVVDYEHTDFTRTGERFDVIFDVPGNHGFSACRRALTSTGVYILIGHDQFGASAGRWLGSMPRVLGLVARSPFTKHLPGPSVSMPDKGTSMAALADLAAAGQLRPVVDESYPLDEVAAALRHLQSGTARGKIVLTP